MRLHKIILSLILAISSAALNAAGFEVFAYRSFKPSLNHIKTFADYGVNTVAIFPANTFNAKGDPYSEYPPNWLFYDTYNFDIVDKQLDDVLSVNKNANFIFIVDLNSPMWLYHHLATCGLSMESDSYTMLSNTVANKRWKDTTKKYLTPRTRRKKVSRQNQGLSAGVRHDRRMDGLQQIFRGAFKN